MAVRSLRFERKMGGSPWLVLLLGLHGGRGVSNPAGGKHGHLERLRRYGTSSATTLCSQDVDIGMCIHDTLFSTPKLA